ncbi:MAG TPA: chromate efflux transporter [Chryseolinea sp.]|nr:chromate efflux transporter [Chryseolinea sp.]HPH46162.1 chromate efflux transporter [Chryseolinea sp.]HPM30767.1 chromate efflux transporter [Chryseolinea sp.]
MVLPGPEAQQLATYIGWLLHGVRGGLVAGILFILPSIFILLGLSVAYVSFGKLVWVAALFYGLKPAIVAIIILAMIKIGKKSLLTPFHYALAVVSFVCIFFFNISFPLIILGSILISLLALKVYPSLLMSSKSGAKVDANETQYYLNKFSAPIHDGLNTKSILLKILIGVVLWIIPFGLFYMIDPENQFWISLNLFFTKAAFVTFGGAYAVLPYVAQESVEKFHWLSSYEMIDGMALGESTPGPLIMILVFVGFMASYNVYGGSIAAGTVGLLSTTFYTFLPCFLFILIGAPIIEKTKENEKLKSILSIITAAVVGVVLNLTLYFGRAVVFPKGFEFSPDWFAIAWIVISLVALHRFKLNMILWIGISAFSGLLYSLF